MLNRKSINLQNPKRKRGRPPKGAFQPIKKVTIFLKLVYKINEKLSGSETD